MNSNDAFNFTGKVAVVTGGSGVICSRLATALGLRGAAVVVLAHSRLQRAQETCDRITSLGGQAIARQVDVLDKEALLDLARETIDTWGRVDIIINGAGGARQEATTNAESPFFDLPEEAVRWVFDLNFMGTFLPCQVFGRYMAQQGKGCMLNIASMGAFRPLTRSVAYSASKAAIVNFTKWLAVHMSQEYCPNIRVNAVAPGFFLTEQNRFLLFDKETGDITERGRRIIDHTPMGRLGEPEDLIFPCLMLLSDAAAFVHGATLVVDGGFSAYGGV